MSRLDDLIKEKCPNGVKREKLKEVSILRRGTTATRGTMSVGQYPVISGGKEPSFYCDKANRKGDTISVAGSGAGAGFVQYWSSPIFVCDAFSVEGIENIISTKYIYYFLVSVQEKIYATKTGGGVPHVHISYVQDFEIPVPPLEIQNEIVRILDNFAELTAELTAELAARKLQYSHYRELLLNLKNEVNMKSIDEVASFRRGSFPQPYGNREWYDGDGAMPFVQVADISDNMRLVEDTKRKISVIAQPKSVFAKNGSIVISLQGSIGRIAITQYDAYIDRTVAIFSDLSNDILPKYFVYQLQRIFAIKEKTARGSTIKTITKEEFSNFKIPVPSLEKQKEIVGKLDIFSEITSDLEKGLPKEIELRTKQYEYYRDKLLTFKELA